MTIDDSIDVMLANALAHRTCSAALFTKVGCGFQLSGKVRVDYTTIAAYFCIILAAAQIIVLYAFFKEADQMEEVRKTVRIKRKR